MSEDKKKVESKAKAEAKEEKAPAKKKTTAPAKTEKAAAKKSKKIVRPDQYDVIVRPIVTEKAHFGIEFNKVTFEVAANSNKTQIKAAAESIFESEVKNVNIINVKGKVKRFRGTKGKRNDVKKAVITFAEGANLEAISSL